MARNDKNGHTNGHTNGHSNGHSNGEVELRWHRLHLGLYARVAKRLHVNPSYVSRVARGKRQSEDVRKALLNELARINQIRPEFGASRRSA
jgi:transcriptional regulator with XRE-family HTH domain